MGLLKLVKGKKEARSGRMPGKEDRGHPLKEEVKHEETVRSAAGSVLAFFCCLG